MFTFAFTGALLVLATHATTNSVSFEAENGTRTGNVCGKSDAAASGVSLVRFGQACKDIFVSTTGSDSNNGTSVALSVKTLNKAVLLATGPTRIRIMAGTYIQTFRIKKNDITVEPYGNGDVNIIGSIPEFISGVSWSIPGVIAS